MIYDKERLNLQEKIRLLIVEWEKKTKLRVERIEVNHGSDPTNVQLIGCNVILEIEDD